MSTFCLHVREEQAIASVYLCHLGASPSPFPFQKHLKDEIGKKILAHISLRTHLLHYERPVVVMAEVNNLGKTQTQEDLSCHSP